MRHRFGIALAACGMVALFAAVTRPSAALAETGSRLGWPLDSQADVGLGFGASYASDERTCVHHGLDILAAQGSAVKACERATVAFVGRVPADGGGTVLAVSLEDPEGRRITLMPLEASSVAAGSHVDAGAEIGRLASSGDGSLSAPHLHIGVRINDTYLDPASLLDRPAADGAPSDPQPPAEPAERPAQPTASSPGKVWTPAPEPASPVSQPPQSPATRPSMTAAPRSAAVEAGVPSGTTHQASAYRADPPVQAKAVGSGGSSAGSAVGSRSGGVAPVSTARDKAGYPLAERLGAFRSTAGRAVLALMEGLLAVALIRPVVRRTAAGMAQPAMARARE